MNTSSTLLICSRCEHRNRAVARFCARCGDALHDARRVSGGGRPAGSRIVVGLLAIGVMLASYALFARVKPQRPLPMNLWNPPDVEKLLEQEKAREGYVKQQKSKQPLSPPDATDSERTTIIEYRMEGPYQEIVE